MDLLPKELVLQIGLYLNETDFSNYLETIEYSLGTSDYIFLLINRYPGYYKSGINKYNVGFIYKSLLQIEDYMSKRIARLSANIDPNTGIPYGKHFIDKLYINNYKHTIEYISDYDVTTEVYLYELYKYLYLENFIEFGDGRMDPVFLMDDLDIFMKFESFRSDDNPKFLAINTNSYKILEYLLQKEDRDDIMEFLPELYENFSIDLDITKLLFKYIDIPDNEILNIIFQSNENNLESIKYMFTKVDKGDTNVFIRELIGSYGNGIIINYDIFKKVWSEYSDRLTREQVIEIFDGITSVNMRDGSVTDWKKTILLLSQHPAVIKAYLDL